MTTFVAKMTAPIANRVRFEWHHLKLEWRHDPSGRYSAIAAAIGLTAGLVINFAPRIF